MAVGAEDAATVGVIQQRKFARYFVLIGGNVLAEDAQIRIAIAFLHIAQHLVITPVLLDNINDVFEHARFARPFGNGPRRLAVARWQTRLRQPRVTNVGQRLTVQFGQLPRIRFAHQR